MQRLSFSEALEEIHPQTGEKPRKAGKWFRSQIHLGHKSPFYELLEFTRKFIPESKIALPCGASSKFRLLLRSESCSRAEHPEHELPCGASSKFRRFIIKSRAPVPSVLNFSNKIAFLCGASLRFRHLFIKNCAPVRSILKIRSI